MVISLGIGYLIAENMIGRKAALRNLRDAVLWLLIGFAIALVIPLIREDGWSIFLILYAVGMNI